MAASVPKDPALDSTISLLREGFGFIGSRCDRFGSDLFETRLLGERTMCMRGPAAAEVFYTGERFTRRGAFPPRILKLLQDEGSVATLEDAAHHARKRLFLDTLSPQQRDTHVQALEDAWREALAHWAAQDRIILLEAAEQVLLLAACRWAGIPLKPEDAAERAQWMATVIDGTGRIGWPYWRARIYRGKVEAWFKSIIRQIRDGQMDLPDHAAAKRVAMFEDPGRGRMSEEVAANELLNFTRPTVAVGRFIMYMALAVHHHPSWRDRLTGADDATVDCFIQEVRRYYPFFPFIAGVARSDVGLGEVAIPEGRRVLLDIYGTNRSPASWDAPDTFHPERFRGYDQVRGFGSIPQGGGDYYTSHRCPGEPLTIDLCKAAARLLVDETEYQVPEQDLSIDLRRIPAQPASRMMLTAVRAKAAQATPRTAGQA